MLWGGVAIILIIIGILIFRSKDEVASTNSTDNTSTSQTNTNVPGMNTTLGGIFDEKGNYQCDYTSVSQQSRSSNVIYISGGKLRAEFRTITATGSTGTLMFYDGTYLYTWTEGKSTGTISQPRTLKDFPALIPEDITSGKILGTSANNVSWICRDWLKDATKLVKPTYVKFN